MSRYWEVIGPVAILALGTLSFVSARLASPHPGVHADRLADVEDTPDVRDQTVPVAPVAGLPPWAAPEADRYTGYGGASGSLGSDYGGPGEEIWQSDLTPDQEAALRRELHHVDDLWPEDVPVPSTARHGHGGAGDESEGSGLTAPPAPARLYQWAPGTAEPNIEPPRDPNGIHSPTRLASATDVANARADAFMAIMRADHQRWMALARERWAAA